MVVFSLSLFKPSVCCLFDFSHKYTVSFDQKSRSLWFFLLLWFQVHLKYIRKKLLSIFLWISISFTHINLIYAVLFRYVESENAKPAENIHTLIHSHIERGNIRKKTCLQLKYIWYPKKNYVELWPRFYPIVVNIYIQYI